MLFYLLVFVACSENTEVVGINGSLAGEVFLKDAAGKDSDSHEGVLITMDNGKNIHKTFSDKDGGFIMYGLISGTYDITFSKEGFNPYKKYGYAFVGGEETAQLSETINLVAQSHIYLANLKMKIYLIDGSTYFSATSELLYNPKKLSYTGARYFLSTSDAVSSNFYLQTGVTGNRVGVERVTFNFPIQDKALLAARKIYLIVYACSSCELYYIDNVSGNNVYYTTNIRSSNVAEAFMP
ncbi:MAG: carboxypeptidase regulatory-like domain-containing protein [Cyclobacteriaceae bacterium]|nr:carboxypeptidase regulatory-like domain-containing protein [Cyclobacteriaceae bacterium]